MSSDGILSVSFSLKIKRRNLGVLSWPIRTFLALVLVFLTNYSPFGDSCVLVRSVPPLVVLSVAAGVSSFVNCDDLIMSLGRGQDGYSGGVVAHALLLNLIHDVNSPFFRFQDTSVPLVPIKVRHHD